MMFFFKPSHIIMRATGVIYSRKTSKISDLSRKQYGCKSN